MYTAKFRKTPPPQAFFRLFDEEDAELGPCAAGPPGGVPPPVLDHVVELLEKIVSASLVELVQVIAVRKISLDRIPQGSAGRRTQMAEQLVEVPTEPWSRREIRGFLPGQGTTASGEELIVDTPVPQCRREVAEVVKVLPEQSPAAADLEQVVDIPACRCLQGFRPCQGSPGSSSRRLHDDADEGIQVVFRTLPQFSKSAAPGVEPIHAASSCRAYGSRGGRVSDGVGV